MKLFKIFIFIQEYFWKEVLWKVWYSKNERKFAFFVLIKLVSDSEKMQHDFKSINTYMQHNITNVHKPDKHIRNILAADLKTDFKKWRLHNWKELSEKWWYVSC